MVFAPNGLLTLTTDFGLAEPFVGIMKGRIYGCLPAARIVDLSHANPPGRADLAGFWLGHAWREFPPGAVHLAVVDPGVGTRRGIALAECRGHVLLAPDNGLLPEALRGIDGATWRRLDPALPGRLGLGPLSRTFHGRDLFAPLAALLAAGELEPDGFGPACEPADPRPLPRAVAKGDTVRGQVLLADGFGNLFTNIEVALLARMSRPELHVGDLRLPLLPTYGDGVTGQPLAVVNAFGLVEIAVRDGSALATLGAAPGSPVVIRNCSGATDG
mgnify:FL=1